jgi:soluble lytic murein transglycosylase-like protein
MHARYTPPKSLEPFRVRAKKFDHFINWAARSFELEPALIKAVIHAESAFDHNATSHAGAQGLMQLMPATGRSHGVTNPYNPHQNIMGGSKHLRYLMDKYDGNLELVLAAYNAGEVPVRKYNGIPPYKETQQYVKRVIKFYQRYSKELAS